ncbi:MAG TPA: hypothetical protein VL285_22830 [Bryobacteraceae bacterium]|nr:hypothetical protein [Bryobacteraceae bacterium]
MPRNDEGDFELVLGNRQLLSGFFIIVILFGIFFTMGYIVGRHSSPAPVAGGAPEPATVRAASPAGPPPGVAEVVTADAKRGETPPPEPPPPVVTQPATAAAEAPRPPAKVETVAVRSGVAEPPAGSYLQVAAPKRAAAEGVVESLRNKGIAALLAPGPNEETVRVLVGPLDSSTIGKMRLDLEAAGFKPFPKKY